VKNDLLCSGWILYRGNHVLYRDENILPSLRQTGALGRGRKTGT
jgi:hypothetical protein